MTISISNNTPRVAYTVSEGATQTSFTVSFEFFNAADLNVYVDGVKKTLTTNYTVSGGSGSTGAVAISVTGGTGGSSVIITRDITLERTTDFPVSGAFVVETLNTELDRFVAIQADLNDEITRSIRLADDDSVASMELPDKADRLGKVLSFHSTTGAVQVQDYASPTATAAIDGVTAGTVAASKFVQVDANKDIGTFRNLTASGTITGAAFVIGSASINENDLEALDDVTAGTVAASKAVIVDTNKDISSFRNLTATGEVGAGRVNLSSAVSSSALTSDPAQVGYHATDGLLLMGQGSANDVALINDLGNIVARIPTGLQQFIVNGSFQVSGSTGGKAYLTTSEQTVVADDSLGALEWYSPSETSGTDSTGKSGAIECVAEGEFTATANPTKMEFKLGVSEAATTKMSLSSSGDLNITGELQANKIAFTDGDDAITIANTGLIEFNTGFNVGSDASGDILYNNGTKYVRLAKGTDGQTLTLSSGIPAWSTGAGDIEGVTAGTGLSGGGTGGTVTLNIDTATTVDKTTSQTLTNKTLTAPAISDPTLTVDNLSSISTVAGDDLFLAIDTSGGGLKKITRSTLVAGLATSSALTEVVADTSPELGGDLDVLTRAIITQTGNRNIALTPHGTGVVMIDGNVGIESGTIDLKNSGSVSNIKFYCEDSNAHYTQVQSAPHSAYSGNVTVVLPASSDTLVGRDTTDTLTNKTLTNPVISNIQNTSLTIGRDADNLIKFDTDDVIGFRIAANDDRWKFQLNSLTPASDGGQMLGFASKRFSELHTVKIEVLDTDNDATGAEINLSKKRGTGTSPAGQDGDVCGEINFKGRDAGGNGNIYSRIQGRINTATNGSEIGEMYFLNSINSIVTTVVKIEGNDMTIAGDLTISGDDLKMATNTSGHILVADGTSYNPVAVSGDVTISNTGAITIAAGAVENSMLADDAVGADELASNAVVTASIVDDNVTQAKIADDAVGADQLASNAVVTASIADDAVTLAKMAGITRGSIIVGDSSGNPSALAAGTNGKVLTTDGTDLSWQTPASPDAGITTGKAIAMAMIFG